MADTPPQRLASLDTYRGIVMLLMLAEVLRLPAVAKAIPTSEFWKFLAFHQSHVDWVGCSLHDMIQPSFSFLVGVSLPFSIASRLGHGQSQLRMTAHAFWRGFVLIALGIFLRSIGKNQTNYTFEDTLSQIGLGYGFLFLLGLRTVRVQLIALGTILIGYWLAFALWPLPGSDFDWSVTGVKPDWQHNVTGFAAHWNKNTNLAWAFDTWWMNLFPREKPFLFNGGGYSTLSFIPTLGTMILGLLAGGVLKSERPAIGKLQILGMTGISLLLAGYALGQLGLCPVVKKIWTPSWVLFSGGWCMLAMGILYAIIDAGQFRRWTFPLVVIGANSIVAYCMEWFFIGFIIAAIKRHLGKETFQVLGSEYESLLLGSCVLLVLWLILFWMYQRKIFVRI